MEGWVGWDGWNGWDGEVGIYCFCIGKTNNKMATLTSTFLTAGHCPFHHTMMGMAPYLILTLKKRR